MNTEVFDTGDSVWRWKRRVIWQYVLDYESYQVCKPSGRPSGALAEILYGIEESNGGLASALDKEIGKNRFPRFDTVKKLSKMKVQVHALWFATWLCCSVVEFSSSCFVNSTSLEVAYVPGFFWYLPAFTVALKFVIYFHKRWYSTQTYPLCSHRRCSTISTPSALATICLSNGTPKQIER